MIQEAAVQTPIDIQTNKSDNGQIDCNEIQMDYSENILSSETNKFSDNNNRIRLRNQNGRENRVKSVDHIQTKLTFEFPLILIPELAYLSLDSNFIPSLSFVTTRKLSALIKASPKLFSYLFSTRFHRNEYLFRKIDNSHLLILFSLFEENKIFAKKQLLWRIWEQ
jgi:hypothetical protein